MVRFVFASAAVIVVAVALGLLLAPWVGIVVFALSVLIAAVAYLRADNPDQRTPLRDAERERHPHGAPPGTRHVLVVANDELRGDELSSRIVRASDEAVEIDVLAPVLTSESHYNVSDIDKELSEARSRLDRSLAWANKHGIVARGQVGDPSPTSALEDQLRDFGADEVIVVTHSRDRETWQERGELDRLRRELDIPVTHVVVGEGAEEPPSSA